MKARSVARELAVFALFQMESKGEVQSWDKLAFSEILTNTVRSLSEMAEEQLQAIASEIADFRDSMLDVELDHPDNADIPIDLPLKSVTLPSTDAMRSKLDTLLTAVSQLEEALYVPELKALAERDDVKNYAASLVKHTLQHQNEIDAKIDNAQSSWRVERIHKLDRTLIRVALAEMLFLKDVDPATVIDESLELAKRFTHEDSRKFIHGILADITGAESPEQPLETAAAAQVPEGYV